MRNLHMHFTELSKNVSQRKRGLKNGAEMRLTYLIMQLAGKKTKFLSWHHKHCYLRGLIATSPIFTSCSKDWNDSTAHILTIDDIRINGYIKEGIYSALQVDERGLRSASDMSIPLHDNYNLSIILVTTQLNCLQGFSLYKFTSDSRYKSLLPNCYSAYMNFNCVNKNVESL